MVGIIAWLLFLQGPIASVTEELSTVYNERVLVAAASIELNNNEQLFVFDVKSCDDVTLYLQDDIQEEYQITIRAGSVVSEIAACRGGQCQVVVKPMVEEEFCWGHASFWVSSRTLDKILEFGKGCEKGNVVLASLDTGNDFRITKVQVSARLTGSWKLGDSSVCYNSSRNTSDNTPQALTNTTDLPPQSPANGSSQSVVTTQLTTKMLGSSASAPTVTTLSLLSAVVVIARLYR
ncbi:uncharacterized protein LOC124149830 [Haliotis rufescens]|uniref:uncharacterized protein LOC124149830 n=1 Tax=Haliotis rufescens TaxID=6454 RepID=UPI00201FA5F4|nr:uncharacterized protein LOC124149830 [Haliotis rufescens]